MPQLEVCEHAGDATRAEGSVSDADVDVRAPGITCDDDTRPPRCDPRRMPRWLKEPSSTSGDASKVLGAVSMMPARTRRRRRMPWQAAAAASLTAHAGQRSAAGRERCAGEGGATFGECPFTLLSMCSVCGSWSCCTGPLGGLRGCARGRAAARRRRRARLARARTLCTSP